MPGKPGSEPNPEKDSLTFEQAFQSLGKAAEALEAGGLTLAEATGRYEQGMILVQRCNQLLDQAELKITSLKDAYAQDPAGLPDDGLDEEEI